MSFFADSPGPEEFPDEYCLFCCHFHDAGEEPCGARVSDETLRGDICMCVSSLGERVTAWDELRPKFLHNHTKINES